MTPTTLPTRSQAIQRGLEAAILPRLREGAIVPPARILARALGISPQNASKHLCRFLVRHRVVTRIWGRAGKRVVRVLGPGGEQAGHG